jgi:hypothetical protein
VQFILPSAVAGPVQSSVDEIGHQCAAQHNGDPDGPCGDDGVQFRLVPDLYEVSLGPSAVEPECRLITGFNVVGLTTCSVRICVPSRHCTRTKAGLSAGVSTSIGSPEPSTTRSIDGVAAVCLLIGGPHTRLVDQSSRGHCHGKRNERGDEYGKNY